MQTLPKHHSCCHQLIKVQFESLNLVAKVHQAKQNWPLSLCLSFFLLTHVRHGAYLQWWPPTLQQWSVNQWMKPVNSSGPHLPTYKLQHCVPVRTIVSTTVAGPKWFSDLLLTTSFNYTAGNGRSGIPLIRRCLIASHSSQNTNISDLVPVLLALCMFAPAAVQKKNRLKFLRRK